MFHVFWVLPSGFSRKIPSPEARNFPKSQGLCVGKKLYMTTRNSLCSVLRSSKSQSLYRYRGWSSELFQVPSRASMRRARNFSNSQGQRYIWRLALRFARCFTLPTYFPYISSYLSSTTVLSLMIFFCYDKLTNHQLQVKLKEFQDTQIKDEKGRRKYLKTKQA